MPSIIPGFEYDIFISYRQKDNKGDRWVSEFVEALKTELESTFKEDISVYFDTNLHDGLLETHDVDASLREKLKCLVFIPIISRTYCDPRSFAWEHEFRAFVEQASQSESGLKVKLPNGNVASRVLPVRIHELEAVDKLLLENELGGVLRAIDFIYRQPGVNRPLTPLNDEKLNLNNTRYRNQINKVSNALSEIFAGLKAQPGPASGGRTLQVVESVENRQERSKGKRNGQFKTGRWLTGALMLAVLLALGIYFPHLINKEESKNLKDSSGRITIAVMPFQNLTNDTIWNVWRDGIQDMLITYLSNSEELMVRQAESVSDLLESKGLVNYASLTPSIARTISQKLDANVYIHGSIKQAGSKIRLNAELTDSKTNAVVKSFEIDGPAQEEMIFQVIDSLKRMVRNSLIISHLEKELPAGSLSRNNITTSSPEAFRYFIYGQKASDRDDFTSSTKYFSQALAVDSTFTAATLFLAYSYFNQGSFAEAKKWCLILYAKRDQMPMELKLRTNHLYAALFETPYQEIECINQLLQLDDQFPGFYLILGFTYHRLQQYDKAIPLLEKALDIYTKKWDVKPSSPYNNLVLGNAYHETGQYAKENAIYAKSDGLFPDNPELLSKHAVLAFMQGDTVAGNQYLKRFISVRKGNFWPEGAITATLASIFSSAGRLEKAEQYFRKALLQEPAEVGWKYYGLGAFLIEYDRGINEGIELIDKALRLSPDDCSYLKYKGWGLYKQGKYTEALKFLEKSWELKPVYNHGLFLHLEEVKKAIANNM
ncbi:MAG: hypothetical protein D4R64_17795 [Porphyromonadaceae bacterium]|nr:MAG: hypothetical protein D4R64_17795 [Porphyromonadaceae bacterium]